MHLPQFFIKQAQIEEKNIYIKGDDKRHIVCVLRLSCGDKIIVVDEKQNKYKASIESVNKDYLKAIILSKEKYLCKQVSINLYASILKGEAWDLVLKKTTELGITRLIPVVSERTVIKIKEEDKEYKISRWGRIIQEAAKQCKRIDIPVLSPIISFNDAIKSLRACEKINWTNYRAGFLSEFKAHPQVHSKIALYSKDATQKSDKKTSENVQVISSQALNTDLNIILWEDERYVKLKDIFVKKQNIKSINVFIGPEGGFSKNEISLAEKNQLKIVKLGNNILRADTACIAAIAVLLFELDY
ncbi:MAG: 16S rRNA (uracil(1498)-N(3))-methyltransferase [Candidatus Firestonebacteria bacterium]|nr:16S rRNA (uracil(1498)-N(3))-methyltransferase [Candidatus Firestonebacteria bacterium]